MLTLARLVAALVARTRLWPVVARYGTTVLIVAITAVARYTLVEALPTGFAVLPFFLAILLAASLFDHGAGLLATALATVLIAWLDLPPFGAVWLERPEHALALIMFAAVGATIAFILEALHRALADVQQAHADLARSEGRRRLLLHEFRHRSRNDLQSLSALLLLRARTSSSPAAADGLREAAEHARSLARIHTRLAYDERSSLEGDTPATVDTRTFVEGLCGDLNRAQAAGELRPVALRTAAEAHPLDAERAVYLGLVVNELVTNAMKYAFPEGQAGTVQVTFRRAGDAFLLAVADDGVGLGDGLAPAGSAADPPSSGLGTRLLNGLAAQLRGRFVRRDDRAGRGTVAELTFPVGAPGGRA